MEDNEQEGASTEEDSEPIEGKNSDTLEQTGSLKKAASSKEADSFEEEYPRTRLSGKRNNPRYKTETPKVKSKQSEPEKKSEKKRDTKREYKVKAEWEESDKASRPDVVQKSVFRHTSFDNPKNYIIKKTEKNLKQKLSEEDTKALYLDAPSGFKKIIGPIFKKYSTEDTMEYNVTLGFMYCKFVAKHSKTNCISKFYPGISVEERNEIVDGVNAYNWLFEKYAKKRYKAYWIPSLHAKVAMHVLEEDKDIVENVIIKAETEHKKVMGDETKVEFKEKFAKLINEMKECVEISQIKHFKAFEELLTAFKKF